MYPVIGDDDIGNAAIPGGRKQSKARCCIPGTNPEYSECKLGKKMLI